MDFEPERLAGTGHGDDALAGGAVGKQPSSTTSTPIAIAPATAYFAG